MGVEKTKYSDDILIDPEVLIPLESDFRLQVTVKDSSSDLTYTS